MKNQDLKTISDFISELRLLGYPEDEAQNFEAAVSRILGTCPTLITLCEQEVKPFFEAYLGGGGSRGRDQSENIEMATMILAELRLHLETPPPKDAIGKALFDAALNRGANGHQSGKHDHEIQRIRPSRA